MAQASAMFSEPLPKKESLGCSCTIGHDGTPVASPVVGTCLGCRDKPSHGSGGSVMRVSLGSFNSNNYNAGLESEGRKLPVGVKPQSEKILPVLPPLTVASTGSTELFCLLNARRQITWLPSFVKLDSSTHILPQAGPSKSCAMCCGHTDPS